jgi:hypothetical protein
VTHQQLTEKFPTGSVVYLVALNRKHIKVGTTRDLRRRLKEFQTTVAWVEVLLVIPGDSELEHHIHQLLAADKIERELFHYDWRIRNFIEHAKYAGVVCGLEFLEAHTPKAVQERDDHLRAARIAEARQSKAEKDAYFASLVAERKQRLGW